MRSVRDKLDFLKKTLGQNDKSTDGTNFAFRCPACAKKTGAQKRKLVIKIDTEQFHCWVCDFKGVGIANLLKKYYPTAIQEYSRRFAGGALSVDKTEETIERIVPPKNFTLLSQVERIVDPDIKAAYRYTQSRGLDDRDLWFFRLGAVSTGRLRRRVIMPSFSETGELNYLVARSIDPDSTRKYINSRVSKKNVIFNEINLRWDEEITLVEGPFDLMKCGDNSTCLLGSHFNESYALFQKIIKHQTSVLLALDPDARSKTHDIARLLTSYGVGVRILARHKFGDVGEMSKPEFKNLGAMSTDWRPSDRLYSLINDIRSGTLL